MISKAYFILGSRYVRYDAAANSVDAGYPKPIAGNWGGFAQVGFDNGVSASVEWPNGKAYFFKGSQYVRYDIAANRVDAGFPLPIGDEWPGLSAAGFDRDIDAVINWVTARSIFSKALNIYVTILPMTKPTTAFRNPSPATGPDSRRQASPRELIPRSTGGTERLISSAATDICDTTSARTKPTPSFPYQRSQWDGRHSRARDLALASRLPGPAVARFPQAARISPICRISFSSP